MEECRVHRTVGTRAVAGGAMRDDHGIRVVAGARHAERLEDVLLQELGIGLAADLLDQVAKQRVAGVAVVHLLAWLELERLVTESRDQPLGRDRKRHRRLVVGKAREVRDAGGVGEEVEDGHLRPGWWRIRKVLADQVVDREPAAFLEQQNRRGGELLGHRTDAELCRWRVRNLPFQVRRSVPLVQQDALTARDEHRPHEAVVRREGPHHFLHAGDVLPEAWRGDDEDDGERSCEDCEAEEARHGTSRVFVSGRRRPASEQDLKLNRWNY